MILPDIAQRPYAVIKSPPLLNAKILPEPDINPLYGLAAPVALKEIVVKTERKDILHHLLGKIMVNPVNLLFMKKRREKLVQFARGFGIAAKRLFYNDPRPSRVVALRGADARARDVIEYGLIHIRCYRKIEKPVCPRTGCALYLFNLFLEIKIRFFLTKKTLHICEGVDKSRIGTRGACCCAVRGNHRVHG